MTGADKTTVGAADPFADFRRSLTRSDLLPWLATDLIGHDAELVGPFGPKTLVYADYVASGRALSVVENFILEKVLPYYANSHTEASYCGGAMTRLRRAARSVVAACCGADERYAVIFTGSGATSGLNRLVNLFAVKTNSGVIPRVIIGPYEHHSNILPWRESGAEIIEIEEAPAGGPDLVQFDAALEGAAGRPIVCAFSAASNVTGITSDVVEITRRAKRAGAKIIWDYAGGGPYLPIAMQPASDAEIDALVVSPHKFIGGPAASGVLIVRIDAVLASTPTWPGGGTVKFVTPTTHDYSDDLEAREESGTPNVVGDIRVALAFLVKEAIGQATMDMLNTVLRTGALAAWRKLERIELLGNQQAAGLPIFSFRIKDGQGGYIHQQLVTRLLSDRYGIQARGGCACAGPYAHRLLCIDDAESSELRAAIADGDEVRKPGFTRLNFSVLLSDEKVEFILKSVAELSQNATLYSSNYTVDASRAIFSPRASAGLSGESMHNRS
ncbi:aminotransferase class V-fold PLP-dependent enzyme [Bradyrhizobium sp. BR 1432]|uniref:aminotransferase class V-fold PLP-dependent enzyme n=1 Tax=Bradyrhizobium sp. BR 1432 TaxID=3447966 RepID=UPI003EE678A6